MATRVSSRTCSTAIVSSAAAATTMLLSGALHRDAPWAGINAMTSAIGDGPAPSRYRRNRTLLGLGILVGGLTAMSAVYELALERAPGRRGLISGALFALGGYAIDRWLLPKQLLRSFQRGMGPVGTFAKYAALGIATAAPKR